MRTSYYTLLFSRKKFINLYSFSNDALKKVFPSNYKFIFCFYKCNIFINFNKLIFTVKKLIPLFFTVVANRGKCLFIGNKHLYFQTICQINTNNDLKLNNLRIGTFSNFFLINDSLFKNLISQKKISIIFFLNCVENKLFLIEAKKKNIPIIGLVTKNIDNYLVDFPMMLNSYYFYNLYIFNQFFFKLILKLL